MPMTQEWYTKNKDRLRANARMYYWKNRERVLQYDKRRREKSGWIAYRNKMNKNWRDRIRLEVLNYYSNGDMKCACCGEKELEFLSIDHMYNNGNSHRKTISPKYAKVGWGINMYYWLKKNNYPEGYQVLCMNCNFAKGKRNSDHICPHQRKAVLQVKL